MARKIRYGVSRNGEHLSIHDTKAEADAAVNVEREATTKAAADGWITERGARETRIWVEEVRGNAW